jgi:hypothetical protein
VSTMAVRTWSNVAASIAIMFAHDALAQDTQLDLTPVGKSVLHSKLTVAGGLSSGTHELALPPERSHAAHQINRGSELRAISLVGLRRAPRNGGTGPSKDTRK